MMKFLVGSLALVALVGCSSEMRSEHKAGRAVETTTAGSSAQDAGLIDTGGRDNPAASPKRSAPPDRSISRKIVYTADLDLAVESLDGVAERVVALAKDYDGYIARSKMQGAVGGPRGGEWTLRMPAENFDQILLAAKGLGEIRQSSSNSQDVSAEYYDIDARIRNKKQEEERLLKHLTASTGRLEEILTVEREISRVRGEVEQLTGRLTVLHDVSQLATVNLRIEEIRNIVHEPAPSYVDRVAQAWTGSLRSIGSLAQSISIVLVAGTPWLVAIGLPVLLPMAFLLRLRRRRLSAA